jgi:hypothetical protein
MVRLIFASYIVFGSVMISLLWGDHWLSRNVGISIITFIVAVWLVTAYFLFRYLRLTTRQKIVGWAFALAVIGFSFTERFSSYEIFHNSWHWLLWDALGLSFFLMSLGFAKLMSGRKSTLAIPKYFSVASEAPEHVLLADDPLPRSWSDHARHTGLISRTTSRCSRPKGDL